MSTKTVRLRGRGRYGAITPKLASVLAGDGGKGPTAPILCTMSARHPFASRDRFVFAHRGGAKLAPENTMPAFDRGMSLGSDGLELDVHLSRDGIPVVIHDKTLDRTTDATGPVSARTAQELAAVDAGFRFAADGGFPFRGRGIGVPRLDDVLRQFPAGRIIIEMKQGEPALARAVMHLVTAANAVDRVCVGSFYRRGLEIIRAEEPAIATSASEDEARWTLYRSWCRWPVARPRPYCAFQVPERAGRLKVISRPFLQQAHRDGGRVDVWVVDQPEDIMRLFALGVDGVISDRPDLAVAARDRWQTKNEERRTKNEERQQRTQNQERQLGTTATNNPPHTTHDSRPTTTTNDQRPTTYDLRPTTHESRPTTNDHRPTRL